MALKIKPSAVMIARFDTLSFNRIKPENIENTPDNLRIDEINAILVIAAAP